MKVSKKDPIMWSIITDLKNRISEAIKLHFYGCKIDIYTITEIEQEINRVTTSVLRSYHLDEDIENYSPQIRINPKDSNVIDLVFPEWMDKVKPPTQEDLDESKRTH